MGCGKSKHDVAAGNTVLQRKKSSVSSQENGIETKNTNNNNIDKVSSEVQVKHKRSESVKELVVQGKDNEVVNGGEFEKTNVQEDNKEVGKTSAEEEKTNVQEEKEVEAEGGEGKTQETIVVEGQSHDEKENEHKPNDVDTIETTKDKMPAKNEKDNVMEEEDIKDKNVST